MTARSAPWSEPIRWLALLWHLEPRAAKIRNRAPVPRLAFILLGAGLFLAALPLIGKMAGWAILVLLLCIAARVGIEVLGLRLPPPALKFALVAAGTMGVLVTYQTLVGSEAGLSLLFIFIGIKILESVTPRDFQISALLVFFLCLSDLFFSQDLPECFYACSITVLGVAALIHLHSGAPAPGKLRKSAGVACRIFLQALPIVAILFFFFPRFYGGFRFQLDRSRFNSMGMSDHLSPGSVSSLAVSDAIAFRAEFPNGNPNLPALYWRGSVFWRGGGLKWFPLPSQSLEPSEFVLQRKAPPAPHRSLVEQQIVMEAHGGRWLFALDRPASRIKNATLRPGDYYESDHDIFTSFRYSVLSDVEPIPSALSPHWRELATQTTAIGAGAEALAKSWETGSKSDLEIVKKGIEFFRTQHFAYSLTPGEYADESLDEFLFRRKKGFCEHYAAAFASLMRAAGLPARVVIGYLGGQYNQLGNYVIVRQSDSHAWCEVWLDGRGWTRVDPSAVVAPERVHTDSYLSGLTTPGADSARSTFGPGSGSMGFRALLSDIGMVWDSINYQWDLRVLDFDEESQRNFLSWIHLPRFRGSLLFLWTPVLVIFALAILSLALNRAAAPPVDQVRKAYDRFCARLRRRGIQREPWEGPARFAQRAAETAPGISREIGVINDLYIALRYAPGGFDREKYHSLLRLIRQLP